MSNAYITAPPTKGKVILHTTAGPLEIELWPKETPKTCRNFVQLCLEGYYDGTIFHRIVKGFIVQGGDPTGTGHGGESVYGEPFADEFHSRLRFSHRGLLGMANTGLNENGSQFFFTLDRTDELNRKNTLFGKIVGDTIFNLLKFGELEADEDERPLFPPKIIRTEVLNNPFDDIEPRITPEERAEQAAAEKRRREDEEAAKKPKGKKNLTLLSFGEEAESEQTSMSSAKAKIKSSHDLLVNDPRLSKEVAVDIKKEGEQKVGLEKLKTSRRRSRDAEDNDDEDPDFDKRMREKVKKRRTQHEEEERTPRDVKDSKLSGLQSEIAKVQNEIRSIGVPKPDIPAAKPSKKEKLLDAFRAGYVESGKAVPAKRKKVKGETDTLELLKRFQNKLRVPSGTDSSASGAKSSHSVKPDEAEECDLHFVRNCESCKDTFGTDKDADADETGWMASKLVFEKPKGANVYEPKVDDYTVEDPRKGTKSGDFASAGMAQREQRSWRDDKVSERDRGKGGGGGDDRRTEPQHHRGGGSGGGRPSRDHRSRR
ncbi:peptidyl-prolyl isomerase cwc27 [Powellomyces hirtus]|nr:peptidyl-prolyl isomerase cwc27 [Powellomyces hirtus]